MKMIRRRYTHCILYLWRYLAKIDITRSRWIKRFRLYGLALPRFNAIAVRKIDRLEFVHLKSYETRNTLIQDLICQSNDHRELPKFNWIIINTDDNYVGREWRGVPTLSFSTTDEDYSMCCPDFLFKAWPEVGINDFRDSVKRITEAGSRPAETNIMGWRGAITNKSREKILSFINPIKFDFQEIVWNRENPSKLTCSNFISMESAVSRWRYLIDLEGRGYSSRVKLLLFSRRVLFLQERRDKEWYFEALRPWVHYIPVANNLSNLEERYDLIRADPDLEKELVGNSFKFALSTFSDLAICERWHEVIAPLSSDD